MTDPDLTLTVDARDPGRLAQFWGSMLDRDVIADTRGGALLPGAGGQLSLRFVPAAVVPAAVVPAAVVHGAVVPNAVVPGAEKTGAGKTGPNRMHLHLTSTDPADQQHTVDRALKLGAAHLDVGQLPEEEHIVLADPEGNAFCVIEPGNSFLAGCGRLGELACDGTRDAGLFWSAALGWPLVWDENQETAIQSPAGGTKIAWGGPPVAPLPQVCRQRFELGGVDVDRLIALGARRLETVSDGAVVLADPDGSEFRVDRRVDR